MRKDKLKPGMKVVMIDNYCSLKKGEVYEVLHNQGNDRFDSNYFVLNHAGEESFLAPHHKQFKPI